MNNGKRIFAQWVRYNLLTLFFYFIGILIFKKMPLHALLITFITSTVLSILSFINSLNRNKIIINYGPIIPEQKILKLGSK